MELLFKPRASGPRVSFLSHHVVLPLINAICFGVGGGAVGEEKLRKDEIMEASERLSEALIHMLCKHKMVQSF